MGEQQARPARRTRVRRTGWIRAAGDRVPTAWFAGIATVLFLAVTAAFGSLNTQPQPAPRAVAAGQVHTSDQASLTVERAVLLDAFPQAGITVEPGQRVLAVQVRAVNNWTRPLPTTGGTGSLSQSVGIRGLHGVHPEAAARFDDATVSPVLQPRVPAELVFTWAVPASRFHDGDAVRVTLYDQSLHTGTFVASGQYWTDPVASAIVTVPVTDRNAHAASPAGNGTANPGKAG